MDNSEDNSKLKDETIDEFTSPSHLENVKESHSLTFSSSLLNQLGLRTREPLDVSRASVREQEEHLCALRKENFNLKLRVYFLEQQKSDTFTIDDCSKQNVELKIEIETLKEEIDDKQKILEQAAQAIEAMEDNQKEMQNKFDCQVEKLQNRIDDLEVELKSCNAYNDECRAIMEVEPSNLRESPCGSDNSSYELDLYAKENFTELENKILDLQSDLQKRDELICELENKLVAQIGISNNCESLLEQRSIDIEELQAQISCYKSRICDLEEKLDVKNDEIRSIQQHVLQFGEPNLIPNRFSDYTTMQEITQLKELVAKRDAIIKKHEEAHRCACKVIQSFMQKNKEMSRELDKLKRKLNSATSTVNSETENSSSGASNHANRENVTHTLSSQLSEDARHEREADLELLESFYKNCLSNGDSVTRKAQSPVTLKAVTSSEIEQKADDDMLAQHKLLAKENKIMLQRIEELNTELRNIPERENEDLLKQLRKEVAQYEIECDMLRSELARLQANNSFTENANPDNIHWQDICVVLKDHLEQLAGFLKSLLSSDLNLSLSGDKCEKIRLAIDKSLDLSRSVSLSVSGIVKDSASLAQLSSLTAYLDTSACSGIERLSGGETSNNNIILDQAETITSLKNTIIDLKKQLNNKHKLKSVNRSELESSESEAWSEPDRNVSLSRMGMKDMANISPNPSPRRKSNMTKTGQKSFCRKLGLDEPQNVDILLESIKSLEAQIADNEKKLLERECAILKLDNEYKQEKLKFASELENYKLAKILDENAIKETLNKLSTAEYNITQLGEKIQELTNLLSESRTANKENELKHSLFQDQINTLKSEVELKEADVRFAEENLRCIQFDMKDLSDQFSNLKEENNKLSSTLQESIQINEDLCKQITSLKTENNDHVLEVRSLQKKFSDDITQNWVGRTDYVSKCTELKEALNLLSEKENEFKQYKIAEQKTIRQLKTEHHTQMENMKIKEAELLQKLFQKETDYKASCKDMDLLTLQMSEITIDRSKTTTEKIQLEKQICSIKTHYEKIVRKLQLKISELEKENAQNQNKLITLQTSRKRFSDPSGEASADNLSDEGGDVDRLCLSSPDLGIDSDQGHSSNNELASIERPLLKSLELTQSMSNILDFEKQEQGGIDKVKSLEQENVALRKKVIKMRHTLQEALAQIITANKKKRQVDKDITEQLCKTHGLLRQVRSNLETNGTK